CRVMKSKILTLFLLVLCGAVVANAGVKFKTVDGEFMELGGRIQLQYHMVDPDDGEETDELFFRRFRPYIAGSVTENWKGKFQWDMGKSKLAIKDAYMQYGGYDSMKVTLGNMTFPFSREQLTSSKKQQLVERTFVGNHNYGTPDRQTGIHLSGHNSAKTMTWAVSGVKAAVDPSNSKLDFDTVIQVDAGSDWSEGEMVGGRVGLYPQGYEKPSQGDFSGDFRTYIALAGFSWSNDEDNLDSERGDDVDSVTGLEISAGLRKAGLSVDAQYNAFDSELTDSGVTDGIYENSETTLSSYAMEGGYMVIPGKVEVVAGYQSQDADNYAKSWNRISGGLNYFVNKHKMKYQLTYRVNENEDGVEDADANELFVQAQYVF
ncbi:MAG: porin, partial [Verrucomicrobiota bacterium]